MTDTVFFSQDGEGALRRWIPSPEMLKGDQMAAAIRANANSCDTPALLEFLASRLVDVYGENENIDFIIAAKKRADMLRRALPEGEADEPKHWKASRTSAPQAAKHGWAISYDATPGGRDNGDGTRSFSLIFPALLLYEHIEDPEGTAHRIADALNKAYKPS